MPGTLPNPWKREITPLCCFKLLNYYNVLYNNGKLMQGVNEVMHVKCIHLAWCLAKEPMLVTLNIIMKEFGTIDSR